MQKSIKGVIKNLNRMYKELELTDRLSVIFLLTGVALSFAAIILGIVLKTSFLMNLPSLMVLIMCLVVPFVFTKNISGATIIVLVIIAYLYFPFIYFTNGGNDGAGPIYFIMIIVYFAFYMNKKQLIITIISLIVYYTSIMIFVFNNYGFVMPYHDETSKFIDLCVAVVLVSSVMSIVAYASFKAYRIERAKTMKLYEELETKNKELEKLLIIDSLTEIYNRRYFIDKLQTELEYAKENKTLIYIMMLDVDFFKKVNDNYGHLFGDEVLKKIAQTIKGNVRSFDVLARYGGEEFVVLLVNINYEDTMKLAERIRSSVEKIKYRDGGPITISIGVSEYKIKDTLESLIKRADESLYLAKENGRNRVVGCINN